MSKRIILILGFLVGMLAVLCFLGSRKQEPGGSRSTFRIAPFDGRSKAFLLDREAMWFAIDGDNLALSGFMRAAGLTPSVRSLTNFLTSATPEYVRSKPYRWARPRQAIKANALATMKESYLELATLYNTNAHPTLLVSDDGRLGLLWTHTNAVIVFEDGPNGLQETLYHEKANARRSEGLSTEGDL